jgi:hypothetical protein
VHGYGGIGQSISRHPELPVFAAPVRLSSAITVVDYGCRVRISEFWMAVSDEFGHGYGRVLTHDLVLGDLGGRTAEQAIAAGLPAREIWLALCEASDVPPERRYGVGQHEPKK